MNITHKAVFLSASRVVKISSILLLLLFSLFALPRGASLASFCACCAEPGEWFERTGKLLKHETEEVRKVKFGTTASVYLTAVGYEDVKGLPGQYESFSLKHSYGPNHSMTLALKGERGETGSLVLSLPLSATTFGADMHDSPEGSASPILYKEWRFKGTVSGSGIFKKDIAPGTKFHLILQGRGNNCLSATDFRNWRLQITGPRADFALYGSLVDPQ